jgi:hypothetical protein
VSATCGERPTFEPAGPAPDAVVDREIERVVQTLHADEAARTDLFGGVARLAALRQKIDGGRFTAARVPHPRRAFTQKFNDADDNVIASLVVAETVAETSRLPRRDPFHPAS